jgi:DNA-binding response OmpR family regulator
MNILAVEDDDNLGIILSEYLTAKGYKTTLKRNGQEGFEAYKNGDFDLVLLDVMMPVKDGFTTAKEIRAIDDSTPIIFLTAKSMKDDAIEGFKIGADDYITKPFSMEELLLRIKAVLKRTHNDDKPREEKFLYDVGQYVFDYKHQILKLGDEEQRLTSKENELLHLLCTKTNDVLDRSYALKTIWEDDSYFNSRSMDVYITKLRKYLKKDENVQIINVHGKGFKLLVD